MKRSMSFVLCCVVLACAGCWLAAIPRYEEIERPVNAADLVGVWTLSAESMDAMETDHFSADPKVSHSITFRTDGTCYYDTLVRTTYLKQEGKWTVRFAASESFKNSLDFHFSDLVISRAHIAMDKKRMIIWESWGDPDAGVDLVYIKKEAPNQSPEPMPLKRHGSS